MEAKMGGKLEQNENLLSNTDRVKHVSSDLKAIEKIGIETKLKTAK